MESNILVVEDDEDIGALIELNLQILDLTIIRCKDGKLAYDLALQKNFDLIILDIMLPSMDGLNVCRQLRAQKVFSPILMLTAKNSETDRVLGLEVGADDYLTKPFSVMELQARVKAILRRMAMLHQQEKAKPKNERIAYKQLRIDVNRRQVNVAGLDIELTAREFDLLYFLAAAPGRVFSREQLLNSVWGYQHSGYEHTVNSHINRLRSKIEVDPAKPEYVLTVWGVGYKFNDH